MKSIKYLLLSSVLILSSCNDIIDVEPESYIVDNGSFSFNVAQQLLLGSYATLREPMETEWCLTEIVSDNTYNNVTGTTEARRLQAINNDTFNFDVDDRSLYLGPYWLSRYVSIRSANNIIKGVGYTYDPSSKTLNFSELKINEINAKQIASEACFIRAYNYFNLVRLFGEIPLVYVPFETPRDAYNFPNSSVNSVYDLIITDLKFAVANGISDNYNATSNNVGKANKWAAAALLAKVYLTKGDKAAAKAQLESIIGTTPANTGLKGYGLQTSYANVFSTTNEMNNEILFSIRYSNVNTTVGNYFTEIFAGVGQSTPNFRSDNGITQDLYDAYGAGDARRAVVVHGPTGAGTTSDIYRYFLKKYYSPVTATRLGANDWPILRYSDVLLMYAESLGNSPTAISCINLVRTRAMATPLIANGISDADFEDALFKERRLELAGENQQWFDLLRRDATSTTGFDVKQHMINYFNNAFAAYYEQDLDQNQLSFYINNITNSSLLLPIPSTQTQN